MKEAIRVCSRLLILAVAATVLTGGSSEPEDGFRVLSWNVSGDAFTAHPEDFQKLLLWAEPEVVVLDEVDPPVHLDRLRALLENPDGERRWHLSAGASGGRQRCIVASRTALEVVPEFAGILAYPDADRARIESMMTPRELDRYGSQMDDGIAAYAAIVVSGSRRLLVVAVDLQCCGDGPSGWPELRRRVEAKVIRERVRLVLERRSVDGIIVAGDFNLVSTPIPIQLAAGPYPAPHSGLIAAELYHLDGSSSWTWDGRGTSFPSRALDYQLYGPAALEVEGGFIIDSEDLSLPKLESLGLDAQMSVRLSNHRPLLVDYRWLASSQMPEAAEDRQPPASVEAPAEAVE